jgi:ribose transport system permease protein
LSFGFDHFSGLYLWALFIVVFGVWKPSLFLTLDTARSIASSQAIIGVLGIALLIPLAAGAYDLSIGATINLSAVVVAWLQTDHHWDMWPAIAVAVAVGILIGVFNGLTVVKLHVNSFIATLGAATIIGAIQEIVTNGSQPLPPTGSAWLNLTQFQVVGGFQVVFLYLVVIALLAWWMLDHTPAGRYIYATGGNPEAARLSGVRVGLWTYLSLVASGTLAAVAGVLYSSLFGPSLTFGPALLLPAFAAAFLGSTQLKPGRFNVWGTLMAVYVLATGVKGLQFVTGVQWLNEMFSGIALIAAVAFAVSHQRSKARSTA